jgi:hypothetical protein
MRKHIHISWDDESKLILRRDADYGWSWEELQEANREMAAILDTVDHEVCTLAVQNYAQNYIPPNPLSKLGAMLPYKHPRIGLSVVVSKSSMVRSIFKLLIILNPKASHLRFAESVEGGRQLIREYFAQKHS